MASSADRFLTGFTGGVYWELHSPVAPTVGCHLPILLIHGLGNSGRFWNEVAHELAVSRQVIVVDIPGFGRSADPIGKWTVSVIVRPILAVVSALGFDEFEVCGHSFGGMLAAELAAVSDSRCRKLVMLDAHLFTASEIIRHPRRAARWPKVACATAAQVVGGLFPTHRSLPRRLATSWPARRLFLRPFMATPVRVTRARLDDVLRGNRGGRSTVRAIGLASSFDLADLKLDIPVLVVFGARDLLAAPRDSELVRSLALDVEVVSIAGVGHWPHVEAVDTVVGLLA